jgi:hypothetical protein
MSFDTQIQQISSDALDQLFQDIPQGTASADNLEIGKTEEDTTTQLNLGNGNTKFDEIDLKDIPNIGEEVKTEEAATKTEEVETEEETEVATEKTDDKDPKTADASVNVVLKNTIDYLVDSGFWQDFEGREDLEITEEIYADLAARQSQAAAYEIVNELIDSTGDYGRAIIGHIKNGGNPDDVLDIFKEQKEVQQIDTSTNEGKQAKIEKYYKEVLHWKPEKVNKHIKRTIEDDELDTEFEEVNTMYEEHYQSRLEEINQETEKQKQQELVRKERFKTSIRSAIQSNSEFTEREKRVIENSILDFRHKLDNGQRVNDFYLKFAELQSNPETYIDLVNYVMNGKDSIVSKIKKQEETAANKKVFSFTKGNQAIKKPSSTAIEINNKRESNKKGTDFSFALKNKN